MTNNHAPPSGQRQHRSGGDRRRHRHSIPHGAHFHVLYWEGNDEAGITLEDSCRSQPRDSMRLPYFCGMCRNVVRPWRYRMDNMQACVRSCGKEGCGFRPEAAEFVCLSPKMAIRYDFPKFYNYLSTTTSRALTEKTVLGAPMSVHRGDLSSDECGVSTQILGAEGAEWDVWLGEYLQSVHRHASQAGGQAVALVLDYNGVELLNIDTGQRNKGGSHFPLTPPIDRVVVVLGGPGGIDAETQTRMEQLFVTELNHSVRIRLPGGLQHSNVVLADLFMANERWSLLPAVAQLIRSGPVKYGEWREVAQILLGELQSAFVLPDHAMGRIRTCIQQLSPSRGFHRPGMPGPVAAEKPTAWASVPGSVREAQPGIMPQQQCVMPQQPCVMPQQLAAIRAQQAQNAGAVMMLPAAPLNGIQNSQNFVCLPYMQPGPGTQPAMAVAMVAGQTGAAQVPTAYMNTNGTAIPAAGIATGGQTGIVFAPMPVNSDASALASGQIQVPFGGNATSSSATAHALSAQDDGLHKPRSKPAAGDEAGGLMIDSGSEPVAASKFGHQQTLDEIDIYDNAVAAHEMRNETESHDGTTAEMALDADQACGPAQEESFGALRIGTRLLPRRVGKLKWNGRPEHECVNIEWENDGQISGAIPAEQIELVNEEEISAGNAAPKQEQQPPVLEAARADACEDDVAEGPYLIPVAEAAAEVDVDAPRQTDDDLVANTAELKPCTTCKNTLVFAVEAPEEQVGSEEPFERPSPLAEDEESLEKQTPAVQVEGQDEKFEAAERPKKTGWAIDKTPDTIGEGKPRQPTRSGERTDDSEQLPLPEQEWPSLGGLGGRGPKRGKR